MEVAAASDDDSEPAKEANSERLSPVDEAELVEKFDNLFTIPKKGQFVIAIDGQELVCDETLLVKECKYFEAFSNFEKSQRIHIKGGVRLKIFKVILDFFSAKALDIDLENCQVKSVCKS